MVKVILIGLWKFVVKRPVKSPFVELHHRPSSNSMGNFPELCAQTDGNIEAGWWLGTSILFSHILGF